MCVCVCVSYSLANVHGESERANRVLAIVLQSWQSLRLRNAIAQKSLGVHKILVRKIWFPPPKRAQNEEKLYKSV